MLLQDDMNCEEHVLTIRTSTFVDILAGKRKIGRVRGSVHISSTGDRSASAVRIGYVDQADILPENLSKPVTHPPLLKLFI